MKLCPYCAEQIQDEAIVCRYCGRDIVEKPHPAPQPAAWSTPRIITFVGSALLLLSVFLPWGTVTSITLGLNQSMNGLRGDGFIVLALSALLLLGALTKTGSPGRRYSTASGILGILLTLILLYEIINVSSLSSEPGVIIETGIGLYLGIFGGIIAAIGGFSSCPGQVLSLVTSPVETNAPTPL